MFRKALFQQSCKANGTMWCVITFAVCFMLACVMLISGNGNIGEVKDAIQNTIITKEIDAQMQKRALSYYSNAENGLARFDTLFTEQATDTLSVLVWVGQMPQAADFADAGDYAAAAAAWQNACPVPATATGRSYAEAIDEWLLAMPSSDAFSSAADYMTAMQTWQEASPATQEYAVQLAYAAACEALQTELTAGYDDDSTEAQELLGSVLYVLNPNGLFNEFYEEHEEPIPSDYDILSLLAQISAGAADDEGFVEERSAYRRERAEEGAAIFLAGNLSKEENTAALLDALSAYGVTDEIYQSFGYTYDSIKHMAQTAIVTYQGRLAYELDLLAEQNTAGDFADDAAYQAAVDDRQQALAAEISSSFLSTLPSEVSEALEEIGQADLYMLIVGSIFYKLAGLLLPIIYMIMASNNLIAGQVDSGSMAYVLCTSTKRVTVAFTQAMYLIGSLLAMFTLTTATGCVCLSMITEDVGLTYGKLILLNIGAFLVLFALSGLCFFTSCVFDRSKRSMAIGGGLSIFSLVAAMLGLFGSPVIPSVVRLDALNHFNYTTIISLFDVISIMDGTSAFLWKFAILAVLGIIGYLAGSARFTRKDLPL